MGEMGFFGSVFPEYVGGTGAGYRAHAIIVEEISARWSSLRALFNSNALTSAMAIYLYGGDKWKGLVTELIKGEKIGVNAITEPEAGSDIGGIKLKAEKVTDGYILNGTKTWISHAPIFDIGVVFARTSKEKKREGLTAFIVEGDRNGIIKGPPFKKVGHYASPTGEIFFQDVFIPEDHILGDEGMGFEIALSILTRGRLSVAAGAIGVARAALEEAILYAKERKQFGTEIGNFQMVKEKIAIMATEIDAARLLVLRHATLLDKGKDAYLSGAMAKLMSSEVCVKAAGIAVEIFGAYGYSEEFRIARIFRDAKMYQIGEGTSNIQKLIIANELLGLKK